MTISVFGLGYVGSVCAACFAQQGHEVIGVDISGIKVDALRRGESPVLEPGLGDTIGRCVSTGSIRATMDASEAVMTSSLSFVCVGTPPGENGSPDLSFVRNVVGQMGGILGRKRDFHTVVVRSTVLPGTLDSVIAPLLEENSGGRVGERFEVAFNPEFLREGCAIADFYDPPFTVIGELIGHECWALRDLWREMPIEAPIFLVSAREAEMLKHACNTFHALKVAYANEIGNICQSLGIDSYRVMDVFARDTKLNASPCYLKPGFAFGGSCLPKDLDALVRLARSVGVQTPVLEQISRSNELQIRKGAQMVLRTGKRSIAILGLSFKAGTDDLRESPVVALAEQLLGKGKTIAIYDRNVCLQRLVGRNRAYIESQIPHISRLLKDSPEAAIRDSEVVVIGTKEDEFRELATKADGRIVIDLVRLLEPEEAPRDYAGIAW